MDQQYGDVGYWNSILDDKDAVEEAISLGEKPCQAYLLLVLRRMSPEDLDWLLGLGFQLSQKLIEYPRNHPGYATVVSKYLNEV